MRDFKKDQRTANRRNKISVTNVQAIQKINPQIFKTATINRSGL